jgi:8-oxo-dGTP pyrophosphatase MutT (NUDIX family)
MSVASFHRLTAAQPNLSHDPHRHHAHAFEAEISLVAAVAQSQTLLMSGWPMNAAIKRASRPKEARPGPPAWNFPGGSVRQGETPEVSVRRELAEEIGLVANAPLQLVGEVCGVWDGRIDRVFLFVLRLDRLPTLQLDNREIIGAQLVPIDDLHKVPLTGPVQAYVRGQFSPIDGGATPSVS